MHRFLWNHPLLLGASLTFVVFGVDRVHGQTLADSVAVVETMLEYWLAPENGSHYLGAPPYRLWHPQGEVRSFCVVVAEGLAGAGTPLRNPRVLTAVQGRISSAFNLQHVEECTRPQEEEGGTQGFVDPFGHPAIQVRISISFESPFAGRVHFGLKPGGWPGGAGWLCPVRREETKSSRWSLLHGECRYYEA